jgi:hypothetical protein
MTITKLVLVLVCLMALPLETKEAKVTPLFSKDLPDFPDKEGVMITVEYPPGSSDPIHRHNADAFVYVLEGTVVMQLRGGKEVTLTPGQTFYEGPDDVSRRREECKPNQTGEIRGVPGEGQRRSHIGADELKQKCGRVGATQGENGRFFADEARLGARNVGRQNYAKTMAGSGALLAIG